MNKKYVIMTQDEFENPKFRIAWIGQWDERDTSHKYDSRVFSSKQKVEKFISKCAKQKP